MTVVPRGCAVAGVFTMPHSQPTILKLVVTYFCYMKKAWFLLLLWMPVAGMPQNKKGLYRGMWRAQLHRQDSQLVVFNLKLK
jgi:hypothetical protein